MLSDEKILITGPAGRIAFRLGPLARRRQRGVGHRPVQRPRVARQGRGRRASPPAPLDLADGDFGDLPTDFTYLLHLAADFTRRLRPGLRVNAEATGLVLEHCRNAKAALVMSTVTIYKPHPDPWHAFREDDPLGDHGAAVGALLGLEDRRGGRGPVLRPLVRPAGHHLPHGCRPTATRAACPRCTSTRSRRASRSRVRWDPMPYSPIHDDDICAQLEPLLDAATVPATIVNWGGDEPVSVQEWSAYFGELLGVDTEIVVEPIPGRVGRLGRRPHQADLDHRPVPGRLARRLPPHGGALLPRAARMTVEYPSAEALLAEAVEQTGLSDFGPGDFRDGLERPAREPGRRRRPQPRPTPRSRPATSAAAW